ncbi:TetR/AcrR family transcriptional regulator [Glycomyces luteolus]|uniref:TetR/AcrR family transcriptional regulator n=2 Tax=Glycomyces TaxID=58113 RepID=A0A9X3SSF4_9ACTN|nr:MULTISPECIES: TetR/AcrR family transcriptional regulator [Glycomyces]MDA1362501.1 TetR/AcrR family transcriptional regulator [Glycomyces luteolus]MDN3239162.1 TetR/AcrR family transcriptional regulator [Glycomyces tritici]
MDAKQRGRPRNAQVDTAILEAARDLMTAEGYERMTIEAIAARAGVGKQTVYRRWPSKAAIVAEAVMAGHLGIRAEAPPQTGDAAADLGSWLGQFFRQLGEPAEVAVIRGLAAAATDGGTDAEKLYERFTGPSRDQLLELLRAGVDQGRFRADLDLDAAADAISGTLLYRAMIPPSAVVDTEATGFLDLLLLGMIPRTEPSGTSPEP